MIFVYRNILYLMRSWGRCVPRKHNFLKINVYNPKWDLGKFIVQNHTHYHKNVQLFFLHEELSTRKIIWYIYSLLKYIQQYLHTVRVFTYSVYMLSLNQSVHIFWIYVVTQSECSHIVDICCHSIRVFTYSMHSLNQLSYILCLTSLSFHLFSAPCQWLCFHIDGMIVTLFTGLEDVSSLHWSTSRFSPAQTMAWVSSIWVANAWSDLLQR